MDRRSHNVIGTNSTGIQAENRGFGNASVDASGNISGNAGAAGFTLLGIKAGAGSIGSFDQTGDASVIYRSGTINLVGASFDAGIFATAPGSAKITTLSGTSITVSKEFSSDIAQGGIEAFSDNGATTVIAASKITVNGNGNPMADFRSQPVGIQVQSDLGGSAPVTYTGPGITVHGGGGLGIAAVSGSQDAATTSGSVTVNASGPSTQTVPTQSVSSPTAARYAIQLGGVQSP